MRYRAIAPLCVSLVVLAFSSRALAAEPCSGPLVTDIVVAAAAPIDEQEVRRLLPFGVGEPFCREHTEESRRLLLMTGVFSDVEVQSAANERGVTVSIELVRWPVVASVSIRGNRSLGADELNRNIHLSEGDLIQGETLTRIEERLTELYHEKGFGAADIRLSTTLVAPGEMAVRIAIGEGPALMIHELVFAGAALPERELSPQKFAKKIDIEVGDRYVPKKAKQAARALTQFLRQHLYLEAKVEPRWQPTDGDNHGRLTFEIDSGPRFLFAIHENPHLSLQDMLDLIDVEKRAVITDGTWREMARRAQRAYVERGYYFATVRLEQISIVTSPELIKAVSYRVEEGEKYRIGKVVISGNRSISTAALRARLATAPPSWVPWDNGRLVAAEVEADLERLKDLYARQGFPDAEIVVDDVIRDEQRRELTVAIRIEENHRDIIRSLQFVGLHDTGVGLPPMTSAAGGAYDAAAVETDRRALLASLHGAGFLDAEIETETRIDASLVSEQEGTSQVDVVFQISPGSLKRIDRLVVRRNIDTQARVILREMTVRPGDVIQPAALLQDQRRIYQLNLFRSVSIAPAEGDDRPDRRDVVIDVRERAPGTLQWGLGYDTRDGFHGFGQIGYANLQGVGRRLSLRGEISVEPDNPEPSQYFGDLGFLEPRLLDTRWDFRADIIAERTQREVDDFSVQRIAFVPGLERTLFPGVRVGVELVVEEAKIFDVDQDIRDEPGFRDQRTLTTISIGPVLIRDTRDDSFMPTRGSFESLVFRYAPGAFGTDVPFAKVVAHHSQYLPLPIDFTLAYALRGGWASTFGQDEQVPIRERFFLGGRTTVRGFGENKVGPRGTRSDGTIGSPLGGDLAFNGNVEVLSPPFMGLRLSVFSDAGAVYLQDRDIEIEAFRESAGPGLRYNTPVGPISLDYGFKLDRRGGEAPGEVHFSIGTIF